MHHQEASKSSDKMAQSLGIGSSQRATHHHLGPAPADPAMTAAGVPPPPTTPVSASALASISFLYSDFSTLTSPSTSL